MFIFVLAYLHKPKCVDSNIVVLRGENHKGVDKDESAGPFYEIFALLVLPIQNEAEIGIAR